MDALNTALLSKFTHTSALSAILYICGL